MKQLIIGLVAIVFSLFVLTSAVQASEGRIEIAGENVSCEGVSLWKERSFRVTGRCDGLVYPYATQQEHYVLWGKIDTKEEIVRISEVERGYFDGNLSDSFGSLYITAESDGLPRRPSNYQVASGIVSGFRFAKSETAITAVATPAPLVDTTDESMTVQTGIDNPATGTSSVGTVIGKIVKSLLIIIAVVVVLVIGTSLVFRRRGSVTT